MLWDGAIASNSVAVSLLWPHVPLACRYYWGFAFFTGWCVNKPWGHFSSPTLRPAVFWPFFALFCVAVLGNLASHVQLRVIRATRDTRYPSGPLFALVSCPHYMFEVLTWVAFTGASQTFGAGAFCLATLVTLCFYSRERHVKYVPSTDIYRVALDVSQV